MKLSKLVVAAALAVVGAAHAASVVHVSKNPDCGCCSGWVEHLQSAGLDVQVTHVSDTSAARAKAGIPASLAACHTATIDGYAIEGHVPAAQIKRLLAERPTALGLAVPGMPASAPGMDAAPGVPFDVLLVKADGSTSVYHAYR